MSFVLPSSQWHAIRRAISLLRIDRKGFVLSVVAGWAGLGCSVGLAAVSAWLIARASQMPPVLALAVASTAVRALGIGKAVFRYLNRIASHRVALYGMSTLRATIYQRLADSPTDVVTSVRRGDLLARTGKDVDDVGDLVVRALQPAAVAGTVCLLSVGIVSAFSPAIGCVLALCLLFSGIGAPYLAMRGAYRSELAQVRDRAELSTQALSLLEGAAELRVSGRLAQAEAAAAGTETRIIQDRDAAARPAALAAALDVLAMGIAVVAALVIGAQQLAAGTIAPVELAVLVLTPLASFEATEPLAKAATTLVRCGAASERILTLIDRAAAHPELPPTGQDEPSGAKASANELIATDVVAGWPSGPDVIGPVSFHLSRAQSLAIVGPSGVGKSTLLYTLAGLLPPHGGSVRLDGEEISRLDRGTVSHLLTLTAEDAHVFATTVLENLRVARGSVTEAEAEQLLQCVGLADWLQQLPHGLHTPLGTDATTLSGGERRRLLLARALASPAPFLLLDEPAEHLDADSADRLIADLFASRDEGRTIILVTHRLGQLAAADHIIVIGQNGAIRATGTHHELLERLPEYGWAVNRE